LNITGASVARCCIVPNDVLPARVNQHVAIIRLNDDISHVFIHRQLTSIEYQEKLLLISRGNGATREALTKGQLEQLTIILPPLSLQQSFAAKVIAIEAQKQAVQQSIREVEALLAERMDNYFS
jgi:type I restriction enzyme S subunit